MKKEKPTKPEKTSGKKPAAKNGAIHNGIESEPLSTFQEPKTGRVDPQAKSNGQLTTDELADKIRRDLVIRYVAIDSETDFLVLNADDNNAALPKEIEGDTFKAPVHKKFKDALQKLRVHAAMLIDHFPTGDIKKISDIPADRFKAFHITSVHFKYGKRGDSIQINATLQTSRDKAFNFTTPIEYLLEDSETAYRFVEDLIKIRQNIFDRVDAYMSGNERGDSNEVGMFKPQVEEQGF